ncbi:MAG TPA: aldo/keto reductase [Actinomycetota bacterium]|jgi:aryl-alcohol dehydrogenase-like predicted oxidoreductase
MRTSKLGANGPEISVVGFGSWEAGGQAWGKNESDEAVIDAIRAGLDAGIGWIDTAEVYGDGVSERLVGRAIEGRRDGVVIATKVAPEPEGTGFRPQQVRTAAERSMERLGIGRIDVYQLHWPDTSGVPVEETWGAMAALADEGLAGAIGVSNFDRELIERCEAVRHVDSLQQNFSMLVIEDRELINWCGEHGTGVLAYGPLAFGLLTGAITKDTVYAEGDWRTHLDDPDTAGLFGPEAIDRSLAVADGVRAVAERLGVTQAEVALAWTVAQPGVTSAIAGSRNPRHVRENARAGDLALDAATLAELDELVPQGPEPPSELHD